MKYTDKDYNVEMFIPNAEEMKKLAEDSEVMRVANLIREYAGGGYDSIDVSIDEEMVEILKNKGYKVRPNSHMMGRSNINWSSKTKEEKTWD